MLRLLNIEFHKLKYSRSTLIFSAIYLVLFCFLALFASIHFEFGNVDFQLADQGIFNFPYIWHFNAYFASFLKIFLAIVIVSMISNEYSNRTIKQNLIDGMSKKEFLLSKIYTVVAFALTSTVVLFVVSLVLGLIFSDYNEFSIIFSELEYLIAYFVKLLGFFAFCMFLGVLIKRSAFALGLLFIWWIAESIIINVLRFVIFKDGELTAKFSQFLPLESMANLVKQPFSRLSLVKSAQNQMGTDILSNDYIIHWYQLLIVLIWVTVFFYASYTLLKKRDL
ncbi:ABC transporter permease [Mesonia aquimarina]|uniref:ABC transporter permease n=1 Tax=Mesonia aquimarina TaxID=1504967 RepID=UPI000EF622F8|nr:ABC transporter permease subunit [Mesonia aquimarina]